MHDPITHTRLSTQLLEDLAGKPDVPAWGAPIDFSRVVTGAKTAAKWLGFALMGAAYLVLLILLLALAATYTGAL